ncbi:hypothetical protein RB195_012595 [Necator americanus]|uniref:Uncharacterized protein n=1 Tax=Necator americanus TaxID=51031 RepID=A0ABR1DRV3_NECAM
MLYAHALKGRDLKKSLPPRKVAVSVYDPIESVRLYIYPFTETHVLIWLRIRPRNYVNSIEYTISLHKKRKIEYY